MQTIFTDAQTAYQLNQQFKRKCHMTEQEMELLKQEITDILRSIDLDASLVSLTPNLNDCWNVAFWCHSELYLIPFELDMLEKHDAFIDAIASKSEQLLH